MITKMDAGRLLNSELKADPGFDFEIYVLGAFLMIGIAVRLVRRFS